MAKYGNKKCTVAGRTFDSKREAARYVELLAMHKAGEIGPVITQKKYQLLKPQSMPAGHSKKTERGVSYIADFVYTRGGSVVVEDVKSDITKKCQAYIIKRKLMLLVHGIAVREIF